MNFSGPQRREGDWDCPSCHEMNFASRSFCRKCRAAKDSSPSSGRGGRLENGSEGDRSTGGGVEGNMKPGDWHCPSCKDLNFASRSVCRKCQSPHPDHSNARPGDWLCKSCNELNFASRMVCRKCSSPHPRPAQFFPAGMGMGAIGGVGMMGTFPAAGFYPIPHSFNQPNTKPGDWYCAKCKDLNFASRTVCRSCSAPCQTNQHRVGVKSGDWFCDKCHDLNFASRNQCRKCSASKPGEQSQ